MYTASLETAVEDVGFGQRMGWTGTRIWGLVDADRPGSRHGVLAAAELEPEVVHPLHRHHVGEQATYVLDGELDYLAPTGSVRLAAGQAGLALPGHWHGYRNSGPRPARVLTMFGGVSRVEEVGQELAPECGAAEGGMQTAPAAAGAEPPPCTSDGSVDVRWLVSAEVLGSRHLMVGELTASPAVRVGPHRHATEEVVFVLEGAFSVGGAGSVAELGSGELVWIAPGEAHVLAALGDASARALMIHFGGSTPAQAGFHAA